jgi:uncharacterized membrane protein YgaE (UPF0421/DUF939 family)
MIILWCCNVGGFSVVSLDAFIGVIVALLAIIVAIVIGWQIINALEIKSKLAEIDDFKNKVEEQNKTIEQTSYRTLHHLLSTMAMDALENNEAEGAFRCALASLVNTMKLDKPINVTCILNLLKDCTRLFKNDMKVDKEFYDETLKFDDELRSFSNYDFIREEYEPLIDLYIQKVKY